MRHITASIQGLFLAPALVCLFFLLKAFCPEASGSCFVDHFAVPVFLPLVAIYKIFGDSSIIGGHEFILVILYWAAIGFFIGLFIDFWLHRPNHEAEAKPSSTPVPNIPSMHFEKPLLAETKARSVNLLDKEGYKIPF
jgi:hypothetical protein